jgi:NADH-quinone oxidoreductase subunit A
MVVAMGLEQMDQYAPVLMMALVAIAASGGMLAASVIAGKRGHRPAIKDTAYECGMIPIGSNSARFAVKFYLVAMLFILFDIETVFLYPWAVVYKDMLTTNASLILGGMISFMAILAVGFAYILKKGALNWRE